MADFSSRVVISCGDRLEINLPRDLAVRFPGILRRLKHKEADSEVSERLEFPDITSVAAHKVVEYVRFEQGSDEPVDSYVKFEDHMKDVDASALCELASAAFYLDVTPLVDSTCRSIADCIKGKSADEIRLAFGSAQGPNSKGALLSRALAKAGASLPASSSSSGSAASSSSSSPSSSFSLSSSASASSSSSSASSSLAASSEATASALVAASSGSSSAAPAAAKSLSMSPPNFSAAPVSSANVGPSTGGLYIRDRIRARLQSRGQNRGRQRTLGSKVRALKARTVVVGDAFNLHLISDVLGDVELERKEDTRPVDDLMRYILSDDEAEDTPGGSKKKKGKKKRSKKDKKRDKSPSTGSEEDNEEETTSAAAESHESDDGAETAADDYLEDLVKSAEQRAQMQNGAGKATGTPRGANSKSGRAPEAQAGRSGGIAVGGLSEAQRLIMQEQERENERYQEQLRKDREREARQQQVKQQKLDLQAQQQSRMKKEQERQAKLKAQQSGRGKDSEPAKKKSQQQPQQNAAAVTAARITSQTAIVNTVKSMLGPLAQRVDMMDQTVQNIEAAMDRVVADAKKTGGNKHGKALNAMEQLVAKRHKSYEAKFQELNKQLAAKNRRIDSLTQQLQDEANSRGVEQAKWDERFTQMAQQVEQMKVLVKTVLTGVLSGGGLAMGTAMPMAADGQMQDLRQRQQQEQEQQRQQQQQLQQLQQLQKLQQQQQALQQQIQQQQQGLGFSGTPQMMQPMASQGFVGGLNPSAYGGLDPMGTAGLQNLSSGGLGSGGLQMPQQSQQPPQQQQQQPTSVNQGSGDTVLSLSGAAGRLAGLGLGDFSGGNQGDVNGKELGMSGQTTASDLSGFGTTSGYGGPQTDLSATTWSAPQSTASTPSGLPSLSRNTSYNETPSPSHPTQQGGMRRPISQLQPLSQDNNNGPSLSDQAQWSGTASTNGQGTPEWANTDLGGADWSLTGTGGVSAWDSAVGGGGAGSQQSTLSGDSSNGGVTNTTWFSAGGFS